MKPLFGLFVQDGNNCRVATTLEKSHVALLKVELEEVEQEVAVLQAKIAEVRARVPACTHKVFHDVPASYSMDTRTCYSCGHIIGHV